MTDSENPTPGRIEACEDTALPPQDVIDLDRNLTDDETRRVVDIPGLESFGQTGQGRFKVQALAGVKGLFTQAQAHRAFTGQAFQYFIGLPVKFIFSTDPGHHAHVQGLFCRQPVAQQHHLHGARQSAQLPLSVDHPDEGRLADALILGQVDELVDVLLNGDLLQDRALEAPAQVVPQAPVDLGLELIGRRLARLFDHVLQLLDVELDRLVALAIARRAVELHGGHMWVQSQLGQGSTFCFTWPKQRLRIEDERMLTSAGVIQ